MDNTDMDLRWRKRVVPTSSAMRSASCAATI
jgi:hypothetical protein